MRLTVAQALIRFLSVQYVERDGEQHRFFEGCFGIFGHGNVAGLGEALLNSGDQFPYYLVRNEQAMVHTAVGFSRMANRLRAFACTTSVGPGATNMVTGAAVATTNRIPVLLLPGDVFATRRANPVLQELEDPSSLDVSVKRLPASRVALLRSNLASRTIAARPPARDASTHRSGGDRCGHHCPA
jgi:3D-(3,5/4)-trihydroxycyclohexane-1,2-dione acylhydrolase (decyclizing)